MKKSRTSSLKTYIIVYTDANGEGRQSYYAGQNAQQAVDALRAFEGEENINIHTVARVVSDWK